MLTKEYKGTTDNNSPTLSLHHERQREREREREREKEREQERAL